MCVEWEATDLTSEFEQMLETGENYCKKRYERAVYGCREPRTSVILHYEAPRGRLCRNPASQVTRTLPCGAEGGPRPGIEPCGRGLQRSKQRAKNGLRPCNCGYSLFSDVVAGLKIMGPCYRMCVTMYSNEKTSNVYEII